MNSKRKLSCCLPVCKDERFDLAHKFPRDLERVSLWLKALDCPKLNSIPVHKLGYVCSRHFRVKDYKHPLSRSINKTAIPSLNLKDLSQLHLSKDSAVPTHPDVPGVHSREEVLQPPKKDHEEEANIFHEIQDESPQDLPMDLDPLGNLEEAPNEPGDDRLSVQTVLEDEHEDDTRFSSFFEVSHASYENPISLNSFWLRCHCECSLCYDPVRLQRKISPMNISEGVQPKSVQQVEDLDILLIEWDDGHKSEYAVNFLFNLKVRKSPALPQRPWNNHSAETSQSISIPFERLVTSSKDCEAVFRNLREVGVAVISGIQTPAQSMSKLAICRLFPHLTPELVTFHDLHAPHTDISSHLTYPSVDCGLRCYFVKQETELILVDGLNVVNHLKTAKPSAFQTLSEVLVPLSIAHDHVKYELTTPVIEMDPRTHELSKICLDVYRIGVLNTVPQEKVESFYKSLRLLMGSVAEERNHLNLTLAPGSMILLDNSRILHLCLGLSGIWETHIQRKDYVGRLQHLELV